MSEERRPRHLGPVGPRPRPRSSPSNPKHRGTLADQDLTELLADYEATHRAVAEAPHPILRQMHEFRRDALGSEIDRRLLP
jgi:hypothetical protein